MRTSRKFWLLTILAFLLVAAFLITAKRRRPEPVFIYPILFSAGRPQGTRLRSVR